MESLRDILRVLLLFGLTFGGNSDLWAHVGGGGIRAEFISPTGLVQATEEGVHIKWTDGDDEPVAIHHFFYQEWNSTPEPAPEKHLLEGNEIFEIDVNDTENDFTWDVRDVPQGTYFLYAETRDPPNCPTIRFAESLIVVDRQQAVPPLTGLWFESPGGDGLVIDATGSLVLRAIAPTQPIIHVWAGFTAADYESEPEDSPCLFQRSKWVEDFLIADDIVMEADPDAGPGFWRAHVDWDTSQTPNGAFLVKAIFEVEGLEHKEVFAPGWISVYHPNGLVIKPKNEATGGCTSTKASQTAPLWMILAGLLCLSRVRIRVQQET